MFKTRSGTGNLPTVATTILSDTTGYSVKSGGNVTSDGGSAVVARGICWVSGVTPTINHSFTIDGSGAGSFSSEATNLLASTTYFVRAYATNSDFYNPKNDTSSWLGDQQMAKVVRGYFMDEHFASKQDGSISLWNLYNLLAKANKSRYVDTFLDRCRYRAVNTSSR